MCAHPVTLTANRLIGISNPGYAVHTIYDCTEHVQDDIILGPVTLTANRLIGISNPGYASMTVLSMCRMTSFWVCAEYVMT